MERRNRSLKALKDLVYIDSLEANTKALKIQEWVEENLTDTTIEEFDLEIKDLKKLSELFYKNISFLKQHTKDMKFQIDQHKKIREFLV